MRDYYLDLLILIKFHTFLIGKHLYFLLILIDFKVFQCHCDTFDQSREAKWANQHKIDTPTFSQISGSKWGIESKTIFHVYVIFLFKAAKLNGPISTKLTHLLFDRFLKAKEVLRAKLFSCLCDIFIQSREAKWYNQHKIDTPTF